MSEVRRALVVTASNRAAAGVYPDQGGPILADGLRELGFSVDGPLVVQDGEPVGEALRSALNGGYDVVLTTGGTGLSPLTALPNRLVLCLTPKFQASQRRFVATEQPRASPLRYFPGGLPASLGAP